MILKNLFLRGGKQRIGGAVAYTLGGQQIMRELAAKVKNPRTASQMGQRVKLAGLVNFYKSMRSWAKVGAFSNKPQKWSDYNAFVSANIGSNPVYLTKEQAAIGCAVVAPYVISRGSLPRVTTNVVTVNSNLYFKSDIYVGDHDTLGGETWGTISASIIAHNNGIQNGDQISCIAVIQRSSTNGPYVITRAYEITLDVTSSDDAAEKAPWMGINGNDETDFSLFHAADESNMACAFLLSRKVGGKILTGDAQLTLTPSAETFLSLFRSNAAYTRAIESYGLGESNFLDPGTTGGSSNNAFLGAQILSATFGSKTVAAGGTMDSAPASVDAVYLTLTKEIDLSVVDELVLRNSGGTALVTITSTPVYDAGQVKFMLAAQEGTDIVTYWASIRSLELAAGDEKITCSFSNNGGTADPGDVTP